MTTKKLGDLLATISGYSDKIAYYTFPIKEAPKLPFIVYYTPNESGFSADGVNYFARKRFFVELYMEKKDESQEALVEALLKNNGIYYTKEQSYIDDELMWETSYTIEV